MTDEAEASEAVKAHHLQLFNMRITLLNFIADPVSSYCYGRQAQNLHTVHDTLLYYHWHVQHLLS